MTTAYVIMARRGDYSDRTEYAVAWSPDKAQAEFEADAMERRSNEALSAWRSTDGYICDERQWQVWRDRIGDRGWDPTDDTRYTVDELPQIEATLLRCICGHSQYHHDMAGISAAPESCCECSCAKWRMDDSGGAR